VETDFDVHAHRNRLAVFPPRLEKPLLNGFNSSLIDIFSETPDNVRLFWGSPRAHYRLDQD